MIMDVLGLLVRLDAEGLKKGAGLPKVKEAGLKVKLNEDPVKVEEEEKVVLVRHMHHHKLFIFYFLACCCCQLMYFALFCGLMAIYMLPTEA